MCYSGITCYTIIQKKNWQAVSLMQENFSKQNDNKKSRQPVSKQVALNNISRTPQFTSLETQVS